MTHVHFCVCNEPQLFYKFHLPETKGTQNLDGSDNVAPQDEIAMMAYNHYVRHCGVPLHPIDFDFHMGASTNAVLYMSATVDPPRWRVTSRRRPTSS